MPATSIFSGVPGRIRLLALLAAWPLVTTNLIAQTNVQTCIEWLKEFERLSLGRRIELKVDSKRCTVESSSDGLFRRSFAEVPMRISNGPIFVRNAAMYLAAQHGWCFKATGTAGEKGVILRLMRGELGRFYDAFYFGEEVAFGFLDRRPMTQFVGESVSEVTAAPGTITLRCNHPRNGPAVFQFEPGGTLKALQVRKQIGHAYSDYSKPLSRFPMALDYTFEYEAPRRSEETILDKISIVETRAGEPVQRIATIRSTPFPEMLGEKIELPKFPIENGTRVQVENDGEIENLRYEFHDGNVLKVVDRDAVKAARAARYSSEGRSQPWYFIGLAIGFAAIATVMFIARRRRLRG